MTDTFDVFFGVIYAGQTLNLSIQFNDNSGFVGVDVGVVYMIANPTNQGSSLTVIRYSKRRNFDGKVDYIAVVRNDGPADTPVHLIGAYNF